MNNKPPKISMSRLSTILKQFEYNYNHHARDFFAILPDDVKIELLNDEFRYDKLVMRLLTEKYKHSLFKRLIPYNSQYLYTTDYEYITDYNSRMHIRHNVYRTISAHLLTNCSLEEKAFVLSKSTSLKSYKDSANIEICIERLNSLEEVLTLNKCK